MSRLIRHARFRNTRRCLRFEWFEPRQLLSLAVIATDPAPGARVGEAPPSLTVTFNDPIDPTSLSPADVVLGQVGNDGDLQPVQGVTESPGLKEDQLALGLPPDLPSGHYRISLAAGSGLMSVGGDVLTATDVDTVLGDFWVLGRGVSLTDAVDLGSPASAPLRVTGALDFQSNPGDVRLYRITLPAGHTWRLGVEVSAERDGGTLDSALALFDAQGRPIATDDLGLPDAPYDPYLFAGLPSGTYYVGVSGTGNIPGTSGGYDPATGTAGTVAQSQPGGPFRLDIVADPDVPPVVLRSLILDHADPLDSTPTGLTLAFSGAIRTGGTVGTLGDAFGRSIEVVDQDGHSWPVMASGYSASDARLSFLFRSALAPGSYTVRLSPGDGLVDLAGQPPIAPGQPSGVLGTFDVTQKCGSVSRGDLGPLLPDDALRGVTIGGELSPGDSLAYRLVITFPSLYTFQTSFGGGRLVLEVNGPSGTVVRDPGRSGAVSGTNDTMLAAGVYEVRITAVGDRKDVAKLVIASPSVPLESILANGLGQGPALSLRLIAPPPVWPSSSRALGPGTDSGEFGTGELPGTVPPTNPSPTPSGPATTPRAVGPSSDVALAQVLSGKLIGRPVLDWVVLARTGGQSGLPGGLPFIASAQAAGMNPEVLWHSGPDDRWVGEPLPGPFGDAAPETGGAEVNAGSGGGATGSWTGGESAQSVVPEWVGPAASLSASLLPAPAGPAVPGQNASSPAEDVPDAEATSLPDSLWPVGFGLALAVLARSRHALTRRGRGRRKQQSLRASSSPLSSWLAGGLFEHQVKL
jgi:Bacterial pre-peptidase C-terminal domain